MKERSPEEEIRRAKRGVYLPFAVLIALILCLALLAGIRHGQHTFTPEKWQASPDSRTRLVDDLLTDHLRPGMDRAEVSALLGEADYGGGDQAVWYLGPERGLISIDSEWLLVSFAEGRVTGWELTTD